MISFKCTVNWLMPCCAFCCTLRFPAALATQALSLLFLLAFAALLAGLVPLYHFYITPLFHLMVVSLHKAYRLHM
jgi:hypothetical protein